MSDPKPKLGLALGSGAARGLAHVGVLKVLEEAKIKIDFIAGTSIGAVIGALYAAGMPVQKMEEILCDLDWRKLTRLIDPILPTSGLIDGKKVATFMAELLPLTTFEELTIPLAVTATDVETGEALVIRKGNLLEALRATTAFPGIFTPVLFGDRFLVDGGLCNPVPADVAYQMGAEKVIGVCTIPGIAKQPREAYLPSKSSGRENRSWRNFFNARRIEKLFQDIWRLNGAEKESALEDRKSAEPPERKAPGIFRVCSRSVAIMENEINDLRLERDTLDLLIRPEFKGISLLNFHHAAEAIRAGESATRNLLPRIRNLLEP